MGPLLEKMWAKVNGNYERLAAGWQHESMRIMCGAPSYDYLCSGYTAPELFKLLSEAHKKGYICGAGTSGGGSDRVRSSLGLSESHAYAILGTYELRNEETGEVEWELIELQNPWRFEMYEGPFCDKDKIHWTDNYKRQVPFDDQDDGKFFIDIDSFKANFLYCVVQMHRENFHVSYYDKQDDNGALARYTFTTTYT